MSGSYLRATLFNLKGKTKIMSNLYLDKNGDLRCENLENRDVTFRNFSGIRNTRYPNVDSKQFSVMIRDKDFAQELLANNWPLKLFIPKVEYDPDVEPVYYLPVKVKFKDRYGQPLRTQPKIFLYSKGVRTEVGENYCTAYNGSEASQMDMAYFQSIILDINLGYNKENNKYTAYLRRFDGLFAEDLADEATAAWIKQGE